MGRASDDDGEPVWRVLYVDDKTVWNTSESYLSLPSKVDDDDDDDDDDADEEDEEEEEEEEEEFDEEEERRPSRRRVVAKAAQAKTRRSVTTFIEEGQTGRRGR